MNTEADKQLQKQLMASIEQCKVTNIQQTEQNGTVQMVGYFETMPVVIAVQFTKSSHVRQFNIGDVMDVSMLKKIQ